MKFLIMLVLVSACGKDPVKGSAQTPQASATNSEQVQAPLLCGEDEACAAECEAIRQNCRIPCWTGTIRTNISAQRQCLERCDEGKRICYAYPSTHFAQPE